MLFLAFIAGEKKHLVYRRVILFIFTIVTCSTILITESKASIISFEADLNKEHGQFSIIAPYIEPEPYKQVAMADQPDITSFNWEYIYQTGYSTGLQIWLGINQILPVFYQYMVAAKTIVHLITGIPLSHIYTCPRKTGCTASAVPQSISHTNTAPSTHHHSTVWSCEFNYDGSGDDDPYRHNTVHTRLNCQACGQYHCRQYHYSDGIYDGSYPVSDGIPHPGQYDFLAAPAAMHATPPFYGNYPVPPVKPLPPYELHSKQQYSGDFAYPPQEQVDYNKPFGGLAQLPTSFRERGGQSTALPLSRMPPPQKQPNSETCFIGVLRGNTWTPYTYSWMKPPRSKPYIKQEPTHSKPYIKQEPPD